MQGPQKNIAQNKQLLAKDIAEKALVLSIENADLDKHTIKALRLTCKRTKVAADAKVKKFIMSEKQEPEAVRRSGLLKNIKKLRIYFDFSKTDDGVSVAQKLSNSLALLSLAVEFCSRSLEVLDVDFLDYSEAARTYAEIIGTATWESLKQLNLLDPMPGLLSAFLANPSSFPALVTLECGIQSADDLETLQNSPVVGSLKHLQFLVDWGFYSKHSSAPSTVTARVAAAMRGLLQKATNLKELVLASTKFEVFDSENLRSLEYLHLVPLDNPLEGSVSLAPVLARPWQKLHSLYIASKDNPLQGPDLVRIFEAEDTLPVLKSLALECETFPVDGLTCVRRPHLEEFHLTGYGNGHKLISKLAQLMKEDRNALARLKTFQFDCACEFSIAKKAISEFLSCPQMATLESLSITELGHGAEIFASNLKKYCPNLKCLHLSY